MSPRLDASNLTEHPGGRLDLGVHGAVDALRADHGLEVWEGLFVALLLEEELSQGEPGLGEQDDVLRGEGGVNGVAEGGLGHLGLAAGEEVASPQEVLPDVHGVTRTCAREDGKGVSRVRVGPMDESRIAELEIRYMQQQETLQELSDVLYEQQRVIEALRVELELLKKRLEAEPGLVDARQQERPPHY